MTDQQTGFYRVVLQVEQEGLMGAPVLHLQLGVNASTGQVVGAGEITQALPPPYDKIHLPQVTGVIHQSGWEYADLLVALQGQYVVTLPPPAIGSYLAPFTAALAVSRDWNGSGTFTYDRHTINDAKVTNIR